MAGEGRQGILSISVSSRTVPRAYVAERSLEETRGKQTCVCAEFGVHYPFKLSCTALNNNI